MTVEQSVWILLLTAIILANIPWIMEKKVLLFVKVTNKGFMMGVAEWFIYFVLTGVLAYLLEKKVMGNVANQTWEFYAVTFTMFIIFAFPGFIYRYNFKTVFK